MSENMDNIIPMVISRRKQREAAEKAWEKSTQRMIDELHAARTDFLRNHAPGVVDLLSRAAAQLFAYKHGIVPGSPDNEDLENG